MSDHADNKQPYHDFLAEGILMGAIKRFRSLHAQELRHEFSIVGQKLKAFVPDQHAYCVAHRDIASILDRLLPSDPHPARSAICRLNPRTLRLAAIEISTYLNARGMECHEIDIYRSLQKWQNAVEYRTNKLAGAPTR